jgi:hypothetical protein
MGALSPLSHTIPVLTWLLVIVGYGILIVLICERCGRK